jgi:hypothetical protein
MHIAPGLKDEKWGDMEFGHFTVSDDHYENNPRSPNQVFSDIAEEALHADRIGMQSVWIGGQHFNSLGVLSCPDLVLLISATGGWISRPAAGTGQDRRRGLEHDPEKWVQVSEKIMLKKKLERDDDSKKSHPL